MAAAIAAAGSAYAGPTITGPGDSSLTLGLWMSGAYTNAEQIAPGGSSRDSDLRLDSLRIITAAKITKEVGVMVNFARLSGESMRLLDLAVQLELADGLNLWFGRVLPPGDRSQMAGPYFGNVWEYPMVARYPSAYTGRDDGATLWGNVFDQRLLYMVGAYQGKNRGTGMSNESHQPLYAGRVAWSFFDPEPGYFGNNNYYGDKEIFTVGAAFQTQNKGVGSAAAAGDFRAWNVDALLQTKLAGAGVLTLEGAWYDYDTDGVADLSPVAPGCSEVTNCGGATAGDAFLLTAAYLFPTKVGIGRFEPHVRYQEFNPDAGAKSDQWDFGVSYIMAGHNARITGVYSDLSTSGAASTDKFILGLQLMY